jgi:hypothetical protein
MNTTIKEQIESQSWKGLGYTIYVIDYSKFIQGLETETEAENNAYTYWQTNKGIEFQDERSELAYNNNIKIKTI